MGLDEVERLVDFLDEKINLLRDDLKSDIKSLSEQVKELAQQPVICEKRFASRTALRHLTMAAAAGFVFLLIMNATLHSARAVVEAAPKAVLGIVK